VRLDLPGRCPAPPSPRLRPHPSCRPGGGPPSFDERSGQPAREGLEAFRRKGRQRWSRLRFPSRRCAPEPVSVTAAGKRGRPAAPSWGWSACPRDAGPPRWGSSPPPRGTPGARDRRESYPRDSGRGSW
jgi:hypothetical protein